MTKDKMEMKMWVLGLVDSYTCIYNSTITSHLHCDSTSMILREMKTESMMVSVALVMIP